MPHVQELVAGLQVWSCAELNEHAKDCKRRQTHQITKTAKTPGEAARAGGRCPAHAQATRGPLALHLAVFSEGGCRMQRSSAAGEWARQGAVCVDLIGWVSINGKGIGMPLRQSEKTDKAREKETQKEECL